MVQRSRHLVLLALASITATTIAFGPGHGGAEPAPPGVDAARPLKSVTAFQSIEDTRARSRALFHEAAKVITDPRCMNCHPASRQPTQGDDMHPHVPFMQAGLTGFGVNGLTCNTCHRTDNNTLLGSRVGSIPGSAHWLLAPESMSWQGLTLGAICRQIKDPTRNGGRSLAQIRQHMAEDHLVGWAWHPGEGRRPAPGSQAEFGALISAWIETGAECP
ncbi:hypothetical protein [Azospirillum sp.]|uniref:hypothetical protein n=1 Tax=Azospirillum sp. TaxID=34012 RepID=UPI002D43B100|nr:hypothetical protein [Azospirillum sp.]HYF88050.1 hypothetical protein [Azospirillum sp.]